MIITLWGKAWAGKTTLGQRLAQHLGYELIGIGQIKRKLALEAGMTIHERDQIWRNDPTKAAAHDLQYEEYQKSFSLDSRVILDGRMAFWCQPDGYNMFLDIDDQVGAERVFAAQRADDASESISHVLEVNRQRFEQGRQTYLKLYDVDIADSSHYDLWLDTTTLSPDEVFDRVLTWFTKKLKTDKRLWFFE